METKEICLKCPYGYTCSSCENRLKEPMKVSQRGWGKHKPFYFGHRKENEHEQ